MPNRRHASTSPTTLDFIPDSSPAAPGDPRRSRRCGSTSRAARPTRCSTSTAGARRRRALHVPRRRARRLRRRARAQPRGSSPRDGVLVGDRRAPAPGRPLHRPRSSRAAAARCNLFRSQRALLGARRRGVVGRGDDRDAARLARRGQARRHPQRVGDLRLQARVLVRVDGDHARRVRARRARRRRPVLGQARPARRGSPTGTCARTATTAARPAGCPTRARSLAGPAPAAPLAITDFLYGQGDLLQRRRRARPPVVARRPGA